MCMRIMLFGALESENGEIFTGFCIESCSGVMNLCAERVAALNMFVNSGQTVVKRMIAFRDAPPCGGRKRNAPAVRAASFSCSCPRATKMRKFLLTTKRVRRLL